MSGYLKLYEESQVKLRRYQEDHAGLLQRHENYLQFIRETGRMPDYMRWIGARIGIDQKIMDECFPTATAVME